MEWISVEDELPPQNLPVIVKNGKVIVDYVKYRYKKWHHWKRKLHKVTQWKYYCKPAILPNEMRAFFRRAEKYRDQMQPKKFKTGPIVGLHSAKEPKPQSGKDFIKQMKKGMH